MYKKEYCAPVTDLVRVTCASNTCDNVFDPNDPNSFLQTGSPYHGN
jgi:hypothetical protein